MLPGGLVLVIGHLAVAVQIPRRQRLHRGPQMPLRADPGFTLRTYTHLMPTAHDRMRQAIDASRAQDHGPATAQEGAQ